VGRTLGGSPDGPSTSSTRGGVVASLASLIRLMISPTTILLVLRGALGDRQSEQIVKE
jgi:hypothetical protein